jgi:cytochrome c-type biogenesis protein CcmF
MRVGETMRVGQYDLVFKDLLDEEGPNYATSIAVFDLVKNGKVLQEMRPEQRLFLTGQQTQANGIPAIRTRLNEDVYVVLAGFERDTKNPIIQAYVNPLVMWVWIGGLVTIFGTLIALWPSKIRRIPPRTKVVGVVGKTKPIKETHATATNT